MENIHNYYNLWSKKDPLGNKVKRDTTSDKRTTHWVPEIQL